MVTNFTSGEEARDTKLWRDYQNGRAYLSATGLEDQLRQNVDFYEGRQWAAATARTAHMPRPVVNVTKMILRSKRASILGNGVHIAFQVKGEDGDLSQRLTDFNDFIEGEMKLDKFRRKMVKDGVCKGSGVIHYYWDSTAEGYRASYLGGVRAENLDPLDVIMENPNEHDIQKQGWIIIVSRVPINVARQSADTGVDLELITEDESSESHYGEQSQQGSELVTVLTRYFRENGEVMFERATKSAMLNKPRCINPRSDEPSEDGYADGVKSKLYPIQWYEYEEREKSIYGLSETEDVIPAQKGINTNLAMISLAVQQHAWSPYVTRPNALKGQTITNMPGQVITDHSPTFDGIRKLNDASFPSMPLTIVDTLMQNVRTVTGATEVMTGETTGANQSGAAIAQLQSATLAPIKDLRESYYESCEHGALIVLQFYRTYYEDKPFERKINAGGDEQTIEDKFSGKDYDAYDVAVNVVAGAGTQYSEALSMALLDGMLAREQIDFATYIELSPDTVMPWKDDLKQLLEQQRQSETAQLAEENNALKQQLEQLMAYTKQQTALVAQAASIVSEVDTLKKENQSLKIEGASKIMAQNKAAEQLDAAYKTTRQDAEALASMLAGQQGTNTDNV